MITWANEGGNLYDETLGDATLTPVDTGDFCTFSGSVVHPLFDVDQVGIELRSFLNYIGFRAPPLAGGYCDVEFSGRGIAECGPWFHALLQLWAQCRGVVGQLVPCSGQTFVIVPQVWVSGIGQVSWAMADGDPTLYPFAYTPELYLYADPDGWRYKPVHAFGNRAVLEATPARGPFTTAEEAAVAAAAEINVSMETWRALARMEGDSELGRAAALLRGKL